MKEFWLRTNNAVPKFRAWNKHTKSFEQKVVHLEFIPFAEEWAFNDSDLVLQFSTGCKDINGREIYEGDILKTDEADWIGVVVFGKGRFCLEDALGGYSALPNWSYCKVIGNVYENQELLKR